MAGEEHKRFVDVPARASHVAHQDRRLAPARVDLSFDRDLEARIAGELRP
jgi:hypothetical protein